MCYGCWEEYGKPAVISPRTTHAAELIAKVYNWSCAGGNAHIVVDDWNIEDKHIDFCLEAVATSVDDEPNQLHDERRCLEFLRALPLHERAAALAIYDGFLPES